MRKAKADSHCRLEPWTPEHGAELLELVLSEREEIIDREPLRPPSFFTLAGQQERGTQVAAREAAGACLHRVVRTGEVLVGTAGLELQGEGLAAGEAELGYWIARRFRRQGFATDAARLLLADARRRGITRVRANTLPDNSASQGVLRRIGFPDDAEETVADGGLRYLRFWLALG